MELLPHLKEYVENIDSSTITEERKAILQPLIAFINDSLVNNKSVALNFICTHNSRRSHLAQIWAKTMAFYFQIDAISCYSGGTQTTAIYPMVIKTLQNTGFDIKKMTAGENPLYKIYYAMNQEPILGFSKKYDDTSNPSSSFAAIMTCSQADVGCPFVVGSEKRIALLYDDPKVADGTPEQSKVYMDRSKQIAIEMKFVFSKVKNISIH